MQPTQINSFEGGLNFDTALSSLPKNQYDEANDCEFISDEEGKGTIVIPKIGTGIAKVQIPDSTVQGKLFRVKTYSSNLSTLVTDYWVQQVFTFKDKNGNTVISATITNAASNVSNQDFAGLLQTALGGSSVAIVASSFFDDRDFITIDCVSSIFDTVETAEQVVWTNQSNNYNQKLFLLRDFVRSVSKIEPLAYYNVGRCGFCLSVSQDNAFTEIGVVDRDNNWAYTRLLRTRKFILNRDFPISFDVEQQNDGVYSLYFTDYKLKHKAIVVPSSLSEDCCLLYNPTNYQTPTKGSYNLVRTDEQTNSQLINNIGFVSYKKTLESGGAVTTGGKRFAVRFGINNSNVTTEWSLLSNVVPVYNASAESPLAWVEVQGTTSGQPTSKQIVLTVNNAQSDIFSFVELGVLHYSAQNSVEGQLIVNRYDISSDTFDIVYTGLEQVSLLDVSTLIPSEPVLLKVKDQEIKKNRMNLACVEVASDEQKWLDITEKATLSTVPFFVENTGKFQTEFGNKRFIGSYVADAANRIGATENPVFRPLNFTKDPNVSISSPSTYISSAYTVQAEDLPKLNVSVSVKGFIKQIWEPNLSQIIDGVEEEILYGMWFTITKNDVGVGSLFVQGRFYDKFIDIDYKGSLTIDVANGDVLRFGVDMSGSSVTLTDVEFQGLISLNVVQADSLSVFQFKQNKLGEYQIPFNVANKGGYMLYEYYLIYAQFHLANGFNTSPLPLGKFYVDEFTPVRGLMQILPFNDKIPFTDTDTSENRNVLNYGIQVTNLDLTDVLDEVVGISFSYTCLNTVLGSGIYHTAREIQGDTYTSGTGFKDNIISSPSDPKRRFGMFISSDLDNKEIRFSQGDKLKILGIPLVLGVNTEYQTSATINGKTEEYLGAVSTLPADQPTATDYTILDSRSVFGNTIADTIGNTTVDLYLKPSTNTENNAYYGGSAIAITTLAGVGTIDPLVGNNTGTTDNNVFIAFYTRPIDLKSIDYRNYKPTPTGEIFKISLSTNPTQDYIFYGGDTYTQKVVRKHAYWYKQKVGDLDNVYSSVITFYAQNKRNFQLFRNDDTAPELTYNLTGYKSLFKYLFPFTTQDQVVEEQHNFDTGYIGENQVNRYIPYNPRLSYPTKMPTRIYYSDPKATNSFYDAYRKIKPLNAVDLELKDGEITAIYDVRDVMVVIQPNFVGALPYANDTMIQSDNTAKIIVGSGEVYSNRVYPLSSFGTGLKSLTCKGFNTNGNAQVYWLSERFNNFSRYDYSGVKILSDENNARTFFLNNTKHIKNELDANIFYDVNKKDVVITVRATAIYPQWNQASYVPFDTVVYGENGRFKNFEQTKAVYISKTNNSNSNPYDNPSDWDFVPFSNNQYYNFWSLLFNEARNAFTTNFTPLQKRYFRHDNLMLSPRGVGGVNKIYQMNNQDGGLYLQWFPESVGSTQYKQGVFKISTVFNPFGTTKRLANVSLENGEETLIDATVRVITPTQNINLPIKEQRRETTYYPSYYDENKNNPFGQYLKVLVSSTNYVAVRTIGVLFKNKFPLRIK